jgi:hypothetical protein
LAEVGDDITDDGDLSVDDLVDVFGLDLEVDDSTSSF